MSKLTIPSLRRFNLIAGVVHLLQMAAVLALSTDFSLPVTATYMAGPPGTIYSEPIIVFETPLALMVALFLGLSAVAHFIVASPQFFGRYGKGLEEKRNYFRWVEYSISSSVMIVLIAQITGIADITALVAIFGVNASMILFGWLQEKYEQPGNGGWVPFIFVTIFVLFNSFAWVQYKQYKAQGKWSNYLHGERIYIVLSLVAKSLLAWQIFANTLIPV
jgi:hypothetical protein